MRKANVMHETLITNWMKSRSGNMAILMAIGIFAVVISAGAAIDFALAHNDRTDLQAVTDAAALSAARDFTPTTTTAAIAKRANMILSETGPARSKLLETPAINKDQTELCLTSGTDTRTIFLKIIGVERVPVRVISCANMLSAAQLEISLVIDVSSSMIENNRFVPMQDAVKLFISKFSDNTNLASRTRIALVPFSSRVSIGYPRRSWLRTYAGNPAIPERWANPKSVYTSSSFNFKNWIDNQTVDAFTSKNHYWMGCVEPRSDVDTKDTGSVRSYGLSDDPPGKNSIIAVNGKDVSISSSFVAMDHNPESAKSFCPPPIVSLTNQFSALQSAINAMTSQGSTRLDAGVAAGWYTLSPNWRGVWDSSGYPKAYSNTNRKILVFMTDGMMNTQYGQGSGKLDWRCYYSQSSKSSNVCNDEATDDMLTICSNMKRHGIEIYTVAYSSDADTTNVRKCATDDDHFFTAVAASKSDNSISAVYDAIASSIGKEQVRLTR